MLTNHTLIGRAGADPEYRLTTSGTEVATINLAVDIGAKDRKRTMWLKVRFWCDNAKRANSMIRKGALLGISAELTEDVWTDQNNQERRALVFEAKNWRILSSKEQNGQSQQGYATNSYYEESFGDDDVPF